MHTEFLQNFFEYFIDSEGRIFDKNLNQIDDFDSIGDLSSKKVALLHKNISKDILNKKNSDTIDALYIDKKDSKKSSESANETSINTQVLSQTTSKKFVIVTADWLRVRETPGGTEIGKVVKNDELELVSESDATWYQIKTKDGKLGYISKEFSEIKK